MEVNQQQESEQAVRDKVAAEQRLREWRAAEAERFEENERDGRKDYVSAFLGVRLGMEPEQLRGAVDAVWSGDGDSVNQHLVHRPLEEGSKHSIPVLVDEDQVGEEEESVPLRDCIESWRHSWESAWEQRKKFDLWEAEGAELERKAQQEARPIDPREWKEWHSRRPQRPGDNPDLVSERAYLESLPSDEVASMLPTVMHPFMHSDPERGLTAEQIAGLQHAAMVGDPDLEARIKMVRIPVSAPYSESELQRINRDRMQHGLSPVPNREIIHRLVRWSPGVERVSAETHGSGAREWSLGEILEGARRAAGLRRRFGPASWRVAFAILAPATMKGGPWSGIDAAPASTRDGALGGRAQESWMAAAPEPSIPKAPTKRKTRR